MSAALHRMQHGAKHRKKRMIVLPSDRRAPDTGAKTTVERTTTPLTSAGAGQEQHAAEQSGPSNTQEISDKTGSSTFLLASSTFHTSLTAASAFTDNNNVDDEFSSVRIKTASDYESLSNGAASLETSSNSDSEDGSNKGLVIGIVCAALVLLALGVGFWLLKRKRKLTNGKNKHEHQTATSTSRGSMTVRSIDDLDKTDKGSLDGHSDFIHHYPQQDLQYAPKSEAATFAPSSYVGAAGGLPPRPPAHAAQDPAHVNRSIGGSRPPQGELFPPTRDSAYGQSIKDSLKGINGGGLSLAEAFARPSGSINNRSPPTYPTDGQGGLTLAERYAAGSVSGQGSQEQNRSGLTTAKNNEQVAYTSDFDSQSGYERSAAPSAPVGPDYYNSSAGSNYNRPNPSNSYSNPNSKSRSTSSKTANLSSASAPQEGGSSPLPRYPPRSVKARAPPIGILKSNDTSYTALEASNRTAQPSGSSRSRGHMQMPSDVSERTQAVGSFLDEYTKSSPATVSVAPGSPPPQSVGQYSDFTEQSSSSGLGPTRPRPSRQEGPQVAIPTSSNTINGSLAPPTSRR